MKVKNKKKIENITTPPFKKLRGGNIKKPQDCIRLLNRLINVCLHACTDSELLRLKGISYAVSIILRVYEAGELEERLATLEAKINEHKSQD